MGCHLGGTTGVLIQEAVVDRPSGYRQQVCCDIIVQERKRQGFDASVGRGDNIQQEYKVIEPLL